MKKKIKRNSIENLNHIKINSYPIYPPLKFNIKTLDSKPRKNSLDHAPKIAKHLSRFKNITQQQVLKILSKDKKLRIDMENRIVADYLTDHFSYFSQIKESSKEKFLKLISVLNLEIVPSNKIIINIGEENNNFYVLFEGSVIVYRQYKYKKDLLFSEFCKYLKKAQSQNIEDYNNMLKNNSHLDLNFEEILNDEYFYLSLKNKIFNFNIEELEEIGKYSEGYYFGELSLINKKNKDIIIKSISKCKLISVSKFDFNRILRTIEEKRIEKKAEIFKINFPLFKFWSMEQLITLFNYLTQEIFQDEEFIYKQNDDSEYIYFIEEGTILQYTNVSFSWYLEFIDYINNFDNNLLEIIKNLEDNNYGNNYISGEFHRKLLNLIKSIKLENKNKKNLEKYKFIKINEIYKQRKKDLIKISELYANDKVIKNNENFFKIKFEEDDINNPEKIYKIIINTSENPCILGLEEIFELKKRFTTVSCISGQVRAKKIKIIDLLRILYYYREFNYIETFLEFIRQKKTILCEAIKIHLQNIGKKFESTMDDKYEKLTKQPNILSYKGSKSNSYINKVKNEVLIATKLKSWNNGSYLDNILDTSLHLLNPKSQRQIKLEKSEKCEKLNILFKPKLSSNEKILLSTKNFFSKVSIKRPLNLLKNKKIKLKTLDKKDNTIKKDRYINNLFKTSIFQNQKINKSRNIKKFLEEKKNKDIYIKTYNYNITKNNRILLTDKPNNLKKDIINYQKEKEKYIKSFKDYKNYKISENDYENIKNNNDNDTNSLSYLSKEKETENLASGISTNDKEKEKKKNFIKDNDLIKRNLTVNILLKEKIKNNLMK